MRRLPVFLVVDVSESMAGDNLRAMQEGLERLVKSLRTDPYALETAYLSVIAFAGKPKTLTPLVELISFYPPRLPLGSGTSIGAALEHVMNEIDRSVRASTSEVKGDWKPMVFLLTDGKSTDDTTAAFSRWKARYANRANLVAIGIGPYAALEELSVLTPNVMRMEDASEEGFKKFVTWISASVSAQSRSVGAGEPQKVNLAKMDNEVMKLVDSVTKAAAVDEDFVILNGKCQKTRLPYLMKYERLKGKGGPVRYNLAGVYPAEKDFGELSDDRVFEQTVSTDALIGAPGCPHCGARFAFVMCGCGQIFCFNETDTATCPGCNREIEIGFDEGSFDVTRARG